jgi:hypothetical protein
MANFEYHSTFTSIIDAVKGGWIKTGQFTVTPGSVSSGVLTKVNADVSPACAIGDQIFVNAHLLPVGEICNGAYITAANTVQVSLYNISGSTVTDSASTTYDYIIVRMTSPGSTAGG